METYPSSIVCGVTNSSLNEFVTYGGFVTKSKKLLIPNGFYQNANYCNGNCVLVPKNVFNEIGNLDPIFNHALGDFDYSLRACAIGIEIYISPEFIGYCERHESDPEWQSSVYTISERLKKLYLPSSGCNPFEFFLFERRHYGIMTAIFHFITLHIRVISPIIWRIKHLFI